MPGRVTLAPEAVLAHRLRAHHLDRRLPAGEVLSAAGACGVQNSPPGAWETALWARCADVSREGLRRLLEEERVLLQAWSIRGVPLVFPAAEAGAFLSALLPAPGEEPWIYTRGIGLATDCLGMSQEELLPLVLTAAEALREVTVTGKEELDRFLAGRVRPLLPAGVQERWDAPSMYGRPDRQTVGMAAVSFLLRPCAFAGRVVFGRREGTSPTFTAPERWLGAPLPTDPDGGRKLVKKFLHCYGPATPAMFGSWLGCSPSQAKRLWQTAADELLPVACDGRRGWVLEADRDFDAVLACGPKPMLKSVARVAKEFGVPCQVSMEERMGCGVGACLVCACDMADGSRKHVCKDGPVFDAKEVDWDA